MKESTRSILKLHGWRIDRAFHNWLYFSRYDPYVKIFLKMGDLVIGALGNFRPTGRLFKMVYARYHAKVITPNEAAKIIKLDKDVNYGPAEQIIPFPYANKIIIEEPEWLAVMDCPCRLSRETHCEPVSTCLAVGKVFAQLWLEHGTRFHPRRISKEEALQIVKDRRADGCITTAWFKVATGGRTGVICNCCSCCCGGLQGMRVVKKIKGAEGITNVAPSGYKVDHDPNKCDTCGTCAQVCIFDAITSDEHGRPVYNEEACMGCGLCVEKCPSQARSYNAEFKDGVFPLDLDLAAEMKKEGRL